MDPQLIVIIKVVVALAVSLLGAGFGIFMVVKPKSAAQLGRAVDEADDPVAGAIAGDVGQGVAAAGP